MTDTVYQVQVVLRDSEPKIWRRLLVQPDLLLPDFHKVIQTAMGWVNGHLHQFMKDNTFYNEPAPEDEMWNERDVDYNDIKISDLLSDEGDQMLYEYDFGDGWEHDIILEKILPADAHTTYPVCIDGKRNCPPEDCGGMGGYAYILEIIKQPEHEEYENYMEWLGDEFDPEYFNINEVNELLRRPDYGTIEVFDW